MATTDFATYGGCGINLNRRTTDAEFAVGTTCRGTNSTAWIYVNATESVATGTCTVDASFDLTDTAGSHTADTAFASGEYGWVRLTALDI